MPTSDFLSRVESARNGTNPSIVCRVPSGWVALADMQYLHGYCILLADPVVDSINALDQQSRTRFMLDMSIVGDALLQVTPSFRINYAMFSNTDPYLHAHIIPRYAEEPDQNRLNTAWSYSKEHMAATRFDLDRDRGLMTDLKQAIENLIS